MESYEWNQTDSLWFNAVYSVKKGIHCHDKNSRSEIACRFECNVAIYDEYWKQRQTDTDPFTNVQINRKVAKIDPMWEDADEKKNW